MLLLSYFQISCTVVTLGNWYWEQNAALCTTTAELWNWQDKLFGGSAMDWQWLQAGFSHKDIHTMTKFHTLLAKMQQQSRSLQWSGGFSCPTAWHFSVVDEYYSWWPWRRKKFLLLWCNCNCMEIHTASVFSILTKHLWKRKAYTKCVPHTMNDNQHIRCVHISNSHFQRGRTKKKAFSFPAFWQSMSHGCTIMILNWSINTQNGIFWCQCGSILKDTRHSEGLVLDQAVPPLVLTILNKCMIMWHDLHDK